VRRGIVTSTLLCVGCALQSPPPVRLSEPLAEIPIEVRHGLPTVEVRVSGETLKLFLDLGGHRGIALTPAELDRARVRFVGTSNKFRSSTGQTLESRDFIAENVMLANFPLGNVEGGESIFGGAAPPDRNGYIGMPILGQYLLVTDYAARRIRLYRSGDQAALEQECGSRTFSVALVNGIAQSVGATEFGDRIFLWDTGATDNVIRPASLPPGQAAGRLVDDGPPVVRIESLRLGEHDVGPQEFRIVPFGAPAVDAYLGAGIFSSRKVCLDIPHGKGAVR
jgi:hypothetical protein